MTREPIPEQQGLAARLRMATTGWNCICTPYPDGDGPEIDCPVHGIQVCVIKELVAEVERLRAERYAYKFVVSIIAGGDPNGDPVQLCREVLAEGEQ
jgi:hypothetical protein